MQDQKNKDNGGVFDSIISFITSGLIRYDTKQTKRGFIFSIGGLKRYMAIVFGIFLALSPVLIFMNFIVGEKKIIEQLIFSVLVLLFDLVTIYILFKWRKTLKENTV